MIQRKNDKSDFESNASCLLRLLDQLPGCRFSVLTGSYDQAMDYVKVYKRYRKYSQKKSPHTKKNTKQVHPGYDQVSNVTLSNSDSNPNDDATDAKEVLPEGEEIVAEDSECHNYVKAVVESLKLKDGRVLLAVIWATAEGRLGHTRYPYVIGFDIMHGDNNEKRPHFRGITKSWRNNSLPTIDGLFPSMQTYVFTWAYEDAIPFCLAREAMEKTQIIPTDQCLIMLLAMHNALSELKLFGPSVRRRLCKWHKVREIT